MGQFDFNFERITTGERSATLKDCVFLWAYARGCKPYAKYKEVEDQEQIMDMCLVQLRWDGSFGVTGGKVDEGETLLQGLIRETKEEMAYDITGTPVPMATFKDGEYHIHSYSLEVSFEELVRMRNEAVHGEHSVAECSGYNLIHLTHYEKGKGIDTFKDNRFCATALRELEILETEVLKIEY